MKYVAASMLVDTQIDRWTDTHTHTNTQNEYRNPRACMPRVNKTNITRTEYEQIKLFCFAHVHTISSRLCGPEIR